MSIVIEECKRTWRRLGVPRPVAEEMAVDLESDLEAAAPEGLSPAAVIGADVRSFAAAWATERGVVRPRLRLATTAAAALVGAVPGAGFALFVAYGLSSEAMGAILGAGEYRVGDTGYQATLSVPEWLLLLLLLLLYAVGALFAYAGAVGAVAAALHWRFDPALSRTVRALAVGLPLATAAAIAATVAFASTRGFSTALPVVLADVAVAAAVFSCGVALVRLRAVRQERARLVLQTI